jgi:hypothetical protein
MGQPSDADTDVSDTDAAATAPPSPPSLSLGTCGLKVTHAIGVCQFVFVRYAHELVRIVVTSGGCYPGVCLASGVEPFAWFERDYGPYCLGRWNARALGLFWDDERCLRDLFRRLPPDPALVAARSRLVVAVTPCPSGQDKRAKFQTSKPHISAVFYSFWLIFGRAIISWNGLEAWMLFPRRARAEHSR